VVKIQISNFRIYGFQQLFFFHISFFHIYLTKIGVLGRVPDPVYLFDADPDSTFHFFLDPYPWLRVHFETP
jgi:hypothetical protein